MNGRQDVDKTKIFPLILIILQFAAAVVYGIAKNERMAVYWFAAAVLNIAVTF